LWGQADFGGNAWEWVLDWFAGYPSPCNDCANLVPASQRVAEGSGFYNIASSLRVAHRYGFTPTTRDSSVGVRCARTP
jgi:formylglycine-generating enzyme required for sulfatase activity